MNPRELVAQDRRLSILLVLLETPGYSANSYLVREGIDTIFGHAVSVDLVRTDLAWLFEQGLITQRVTGDIVLATLTARGQDVARGRAVAPGVKQPMPGG